MHSKDPSYSFVLWWNTPRGSGETQNPLYFQYDCRVMLAHASPAVESWRSRCGFVLCLCTALSHAEQTHAASVPAVPVLVVDNLGKGAAPLDGPWQFHPGDDPAWAAASFDDSSWGR